MVRKVNKVIKSLEKASKTHKKQASTLKKACRFNEKAKSKISEKVNGNVC